MLPITPGGKKLVGEPIELALVERGALVARESQRIRLKGWAELWRNARRRGWQRGGHLALCLVQAGEPCDRREGLRVAVTKRLAVGAQGLREQLLGTGHPQQRLQHRIRLHLVLMGRAAVRSGLRRGRLGATRNGRLGQRLSADGTVWPPRGVCAPSGGAWPD